MNCPGHVQIFRQGLKSYRDLPLRLAEFGACHRNEPSGALHGIMRVRAFTQDDAHIFCTEEQIKAESSAFFKLLTTVYGDLGFSDVRVRLADRPELRAGTDEVWDRAEKDLREVIEAAGIPFELAPGEGAFYGPKLEFVLRDRLGRAWQCGTIQVDLVLPERFELSFPDGAGGRHRPVVLHRALVGSLERFLGILLEHHRGRLPAWLAPEQVVVASIESGGAAHARNALRALREAGLRARLDDRDEALSRKVADAHRLAVPYLVAAGPRDEAKRSVRLREASGAQRDVHLESLGAEVLGLCVPPPVDE